MNNIFHLPENISPQARNALRISLIGLPASIVAASVYLYLALTIGAWQLYAWSADIWLLAIAVLISMILIRRDRLSAGVWLLLIAIQATFIGAVVLIEGIGLLILLSMAILVAVIAGQTLPTKPARQAIILGIGSALVAILVDQFLPPYRLAAPGPINVFLPGILGVVILLFSYTTVRQFRDYSLRTKLLIVFIGITLIPLVTLGIYANLRLRDALNQNTQQEISQLASQTALQVDTFIDNQLKFINVEAQNPLITQYMSMDPTQRSGSAQEISAQQVLQALVREDPIYINSYALLDNGGIVILDNANHVGQDDSQAVFFKDAIVKNQPVVIGPLFDQKTGKASLYFSAPVKTESGNRTLGVLYEEYNANVIEYLVEGLIPPGNPDNILFRVVDKNNFVRIAHTANLSLLYKPYKNIAPDQIVALQKQGLLLPGSAQDILAAENDTVAGLENAAQTPYFVTTSKTLGALTLNTAAPMKTVPWLAFVRQSDVTVTAPLNQETRTIIIISFLLIGLVTLLAFGISQILTMPILRLASVARQIAGGDIAAQAKVESQDEIGQLAGTFNEMTGQLRQTLESLDRRAAQLATVAEVGTATSTILETDRLLQEVVDLTKERFNLYHSHIYLLDESGQNLVLAAGAGEAGRQMVAEKRSIPVSRDQSLVARAAREREGVIVNDVTQAPDFLPNPLLPNTRSELAVPMIVGDNVIGVFDVQSDLVGRFTDADINIQTTLAAQLATSVQNVRSFERTKSQAELESMVNAIGQKIQRTTSVEDTLQTAIREIGLALGSSHVSASIAGRKDDGNGVSQN